MLADQIDQPGWMAVQMELRTGPCAAGPEGISMGSPMRAMSSTGTSIRSSSVRREPASTMVTGRQTGASAGPANSVRSSSSAVSVPGAGEPGSLPSRDEVSRTSAPGTTAPPRKRATSSSGRCVADSPMRCSFRPARCSSRSSDRARCAPRLVGTTAWISSTMTVSTLLSASRALDVKQEIERLGRGDENVGRLALEPRPVPRRGVARPHRDRREDVRVAASGRQVCHPDDGGPQVPLHVHGERLQRRDVDDPAPAIARRRRREHHPVDAGQERGQGLPASGRREDQRGLASGDDRPAERLRRRGPGERSPEPVANGGLELGERVGHESPAV